MKWNNKQFDTNNIEKVAKKYNANFVKTASYDGDDCAKAVEVPSQPMFAEIIEKTKNGENVNLTGLQSTSVNYQGLLNPVCKYALTKIIAGDKNHIFITSSGNYSGSPATIEIQTDVDQTDTVYNSCCAIYKDKIVTCADNNYGTFTVSCYGNSKKDTKEYIANLTQKMRKENQYKGKCLFFAENSIVYRDTPAVGWDDVILSEKNKKEIKLNTIDFLTNPNFRKAGINRRGLILYGPPGTGKTMAVKSLFNILKDKDITRIYATADTFTYASAVTEIFDFLNFTGTTVLAFEDMDLISPDRSDGSGRKVLGALLNNLDGIRKMADPLVVIGTTNDVGMLDKALANRPCRFDRKIEIPLPDSIEMKKFYNLFMGKDVENEIIELSAGFSGAHIKEAINTAKMLSAESGLSEEKCLKSACNVIRENFFPMTKEASQILYKNKNNGMTKEAQYSIVSPMSDMDFNPLMRYIPIMILHRSENDVTDTDATSLWNLWKNQQQNVKDNKLSSCKGADENSLQSLVSKKILSKSEDGCFSVTDKGKKILRSIILTTETNTFESNKKEPEIINMLEVKKKVHGNKKSNMKKASKEVISTDWYYNTVKDLEDLL